MYHVKAMRSKYSNANGTPRKLANFFAIDNNGGWAPTAMFLYNTALKGYSDAKNLVSLSFKVMIRRIDSSKSVEVVKSAIGKKYIELSEFASFKASNSVE